MTSLARMTGKIKRRGVQLGVAKAAGASNAAPKSNFTIKNTVLWNFTACQKIQFIRCHKLILALLELIYSVEHDTKYFLVKKKKNIFFRKI